MSEATGADRKRHSQELNIFHDVAKALTSSLDLDSILQTIMEKMAEYFRPDTWSLLMIDEQHNELYFAIAVGDAAEALKDVRLKVGEGIAGWVAKNGEQLIVPDDCTGLYNARHLYKTLETEVYRSSRFGYEFSILFIDLDHFKQVNDTHGHLVGSKLLAEIGYLVKAQLRLIDYAFRYGGDEFVVLLPQTGKDQALHVAKRLRDAMRASMFCKEEGLNLNVRASIGLATYPHDAKSPHDVIRQADEMMYLVKNTTRDNIGIAQRGVMK